MLIRAGCLRRFRQVVDLLSFANVTSSSILADLNRQGSASRSLCTKKTPVTRLGDPELEAAFLKRFREVQQRPNASQVAHLFWFLSTQSQDLNKDPIFSELCDFAATLSGQFTPTEMTLFFRTCFQKMENLHQALLQSIAESLVASRDLTLFPSVSLVNILMYISRRHRDKHATFQMHEEYETFFPGQTEFVKLILEELTSEERVERLSAKEVFYVFYSAAVLGFRKSKTMQILTDRVFKAVEYLSLRDVAHLAYACSMIQFEDTSLLCFLSDHYARRAFAEGDMREFGLVLYSLALYRHAVPLPQSITGLCNSVHSNLLARLKNEDLACLFYSLGRLCLKNEKLLKLLSKEAQKKKRLESFEGQQLLSILVALQELKFTSDPGLVAALSHTLLAGRDQETGKDKLITLKTMELCGIMHAFTRLGLHKSWAMEVILAELIEDSRKPDMDPDSVAIIIHAMGFNMIYNEAALDYFASEWLNSEKIQEFQDHHLAAIICGLARTPGEGLAEMMQPVVDEMIQPDRLRRCGAISLVGVLHSLALKHYYDEETLKHLLEEALKIERIKAMSERCLALLIYTLGKLDVLIPGRRDQAQPVVQESLLPHRLADTDNQGLSNILIGLSKMHYQDHDVVKTFAEELLKPHRFDGFREKGCIQLVHTVLALGNLRVQGCDTILNKVSDYLLEIGIRNVRSIGLVILATRMAALNYKNEALFTILLREALVRQQSRKLHYRELPKIVEAISRVGCAHIVSDLFFSALKDTGDVGDYCKTDLLRLLSAVASIKSIKARTLVEGIQAKLAELEERKKRRGVFVSVD